MRRKHHGLRAWQEAMQLVQHVYAFTHAFPLEERYGLSAQMRRAAVSVPSNIAEGAGRGSSAEFLRFLYFSRASLAELETQTRVAEMLGFGDAQQLYDGMDTIFALLGGLIRSIRHRDSVD